MFRFCLIPDLPWGSLLALGTKTSARMPTESDWNRLPGQWKVSNQGMERVHSSLPSI
ncbi:hypothetical protein BO78DRAFT_393767 [Aspergillus sclerotiicarbonarius CBS 121057]|uniref:Uncharacterized protein n=1 Tax=Aspergillus sclerotiicarbonarius (strain CBS 121057 / IBT 28362) TaxID=1448318 RepID=A0A319EZX4_ASPSB|nr:hypothetical protein BO78DRAFT_393767 [Aspergillus sclerotiicarbonarius CBS 121057]